MKKLIISILLLTLFGLFGCSYHQAYTRGTEIQAKARRVALLPLVNLTSYPNAGRIVGDLLATELYALTNFQLLERTEMLQKLKGNEDDLDYVLEKVDAQKLGKMLGVDTVIYGSVSEYRYKRGLDESPVVGINIRLLDVKTGRILWAASRSEIGGCFWFCEDSLNRLAQKVCHRMVLNMIKGR